MYPSRHRAAAAPTRSVATLLAAVTALVAALASLTGCPAGCPMGQQRVCRDAQGADCRCGTTCRTNDECTGSDECFRFTSMPDAAGVCADRMWLFGMPPACSPICRGTEVCINFGGANTCARACTRGADCPSGCCVTLSDGTSRVCAPNRTFCDESCQPPCAMDQVCVALATPTCTTRCDVNSDCPGSCCLPLQGGGGVCSPMGEFCPTTPPPPCTVVSDCVQVRTQFTPAPQAACGMVGSYEGALGNFCGATVHCRACWWSPAAHAYADCVTLGELPNNVTLPIDVTRCADEMFPDPPVRVRCIDDASFRNGFDCLGSGPL